MSGITPATLLGYYVGGNEPESWASLNIIVDDLLEFSIGLKARETRDFALDVLGAQGPYLVYQPPNESMREWRDQSGRNPMKAPSPFWEKRQRRERALRMVEEIKREIDEESLIWALAQKGYR